MKTTSRTSRLVALLLAPLLTAGVLGVNVGAITPPSSGQTPAACLRVASLKNTGEMNVAARIAGMSTGFETRLATLTANQQEVDQKIQDSRMTVTTKFTDKVAELAGKPGLTDSQKAAIETYKTNMLDAEAIRETAVDAARAAYRTALLDKISAHQTALGTAATDFQVDISTAFQAASETCGDDSVMQTLRTTVKAARAAFQKSLDSSRVRSDIQQLAATRRAAVKTANDAFKQSATDLSHNLAEALKTTSTSQP
jgi:hypothetical protein